jgi:hypothetical protein
VANHNTTLLGISVARTASDPRRAAALKTRSEVNTNRFARLLGGRMSLDDAEWRPTTTK